MTTKQLTYGVICATITFSLHLVCMEKPNTFSPENTKFAFDFHGVIATEPFECINRPWSNFGVYNLASDLKKLACWRAYPALDRQLPLLGYAVIMQACYHGITGEGFRNLCAQYGQDEFVLNIRSATNDVAMISGTIDIIKELSEMGYELDIASNIDIAFFHDLQHNYKYQHIQEILALFTNKKTIDCRRINEEKPIKKPDIQYFMEYQREYNQEQKHVIFIDDRKENTDASEQVHMTGIHFKNPEQLRDELVKYGILEQISK